ncbi:MAG: type III-B CRISPR module RAMP protein Cmr4 [Chloroflexi bacterium HGW-Chloroflexi-6]|nr:MAG: type III-B CRISPR module RAMP protein Cmr4 [Chloroflexi bacterium HGW-Chloroflexi-6]
MDAKLLLVHALSPLHAGTGQGVGVIDQPIAREKATGIPFLPGSSIKGVLRDACGDDALAVRVFGPKTDNADAHAGAVHFTDARLLLLPIRSLKGVFAWVTSPLLLQRFLRDLKSAQQNWDVSIPTLADDDHCLVTDQNDQISLSNAPDPNKVFLEDLPLTATSSPIARAWGQKLAAALFENNDDQWQTTLETHLCIVSDNTLGFLLETATEITARIRLEEEKKTVATGALWYEESLPTETVLAGLTVEARKDDVFATIKNLTAKTLQFGGNATVGRGLCRIHQLD